MIFVGLFVSVYLVVVGIIYKLSASIPAALTFALITLAAASVVLVPLLMCLVCASEKVETTWMCRRFPALKGCLAYREAIAEFKRLTRRAPARLRNHEWWVRLSRPTLRSQVEQDLGKRGLDLRPVADYATEGYDFTYRDQSETVLVRCEAGSAPVDIGVGRELIACLDETGADRAIVVTPSGASKRLGSYLMDRPIHVVDPELILGNPPADL